MFYLRSQKECQTKSHSNIIDSCTYLVIGVGVTKATRPLTLTVLWRDRPCDENSVKNCLCSHNNSNAIIKQIYMFDNAIGCRKKRVFLVATKLEVGGGLSGQATKKFFLRLPLSMTNTCCPSSIVHRGFFFVNIIRYLII